MLHNFIGADGINPAGSLVFDVAGKNLYGTASGGGRYGNYDVVFKLTPNSNGSWTERVLHSFTGHPAGIPMAGLIFDAAGTLYGTALGGGPAGAGAVFKLTPDSNGNWA